MKTKMHNNIKYINIYIFFNYVHYKIMLYFKESFFKERHSMNKKRDKDRDTGTKGLRVIIL